MAPQAYGRVTTLTYSTLITDAAVSPHTFFRQPPGLCHRFLIYVTAPWASLTMIRRGDDNKGVSPVFVGYNASLYVHRHLIRASHMYHHMYHHRNNAVVACATLYLNDSLPLSLHLFFVAPPT